VTILSGLLRSYCVKSVPSLPDFLCRSPLVDEGGDQRPRTGFLLGLGDSVEEIASGNSGYRGVKARL
jgi:hypothetical protein